MENKISKMKNNIDISWYESYKSYVLKTGGNPEIFELPAITKIIQYVIRIGDPRLKFECRSPIYFKDANPDGTFDICGRTSGYSVNLVYKMEYCNDKNPEYYIVLKKYEVKGHYKHDLYFFEGVAYNKIYINRKGKIVKENSDKILKGFKEDDLLSYIEAKKLKKKTKLKKS